MHISVRPTHKSSSMPRLSFSWYFVVRVLQLVVLFRRHLRAQSFQKMKGKACPHLQHSAGRREGRQLTFWVWFQICHVNTSRAVNPRAHAKLEYLNLYIQIQVIESFSVYIYTEIFSIL